ncbi:MAG TPA: hypothetical protein VEF89_23685 [Solirubrobacteraceae bacterium]|nr:hypothetical protein [Solirubrobacteraceae bacterium]
MVARDTPDPAVREDGGQILDRPALVVLVAGDDERRHLDRGERLAWCVDERVEDARQRDGVCAGAL